ncbi:MAG: manganese efflux pump [Deltaproteobacteria bacterium]|nr:manganese efflux pump [Deltaproteobacteria bacterium]
MDIITIASIALGLAMDAFSVSIVSGATIKGLKINNALKIAIFFGSFQALMPLIGWLAGISMRAFITGIDHWIVFGLLSLVGSKMIYESTKTESSERKIDPLNLYVLLLLAIATSIDALAVGISLSFLRVSIAMPVMVIGGVTFFLSFLGSFLGNRFGSFFESKMELIGGLILFGIGMKILIEGLF